MARGVARQRRRFALLPVPARQRAACLSRRHGHARVDPRDDRHPRAERDLGVGDGARRDRRLAASRQYPQEGGRPGPRDDARRAGRALADHAIARDRFDAAHVRAHGDRSRRVRLLRDRPGGLYRAADGHHDLHRRGSRRQHDRYRAVAHAERDDRYRRRARLLVRAAALCYLFVALSTRAESTRMRPDSRPHRSRPAARRRSACRRLRRVECALSQAAFADAVGGERSIFRSSAWRRSSDCIARRSARWR